jgi:hypothetical protein
MKKDESRAPGPTIEAAVWAALSARFARGERREDVLHELGIDSEVWSADEAHWQRAMLEEAGRGQSNLARMYAKAFTHPPAPTVAPAGARNKKTGPIRPEDRPTLPFIPPTAAPAPTPPPVERAPRQRWTGTIDVSEAMREVLPFHDQGKKRDP